MRPDPETTNAFLYCIAVSSLRFGVGIVGFGMMSNHYHAVTADTEGRMPDFLQYFHRIFAVHQNVLRGRWEAFWAPHEQPSVVELVDADDVVRKLVYAITNPIKDHLVDKLEHWPGANALAILASGGSITIRRPKLFFSKDGPFPETVELQLVRSPMHAEMSQEEWVDLLQKRVEEETNRIRTGRIKAGRCVLGAKQVLSQHWNDAPKSREPRRTNNPHVACADPWRRKEVLQRNREFLNAYRNARAAWLAGARDVVFPYGVWSLRRLPGVRCAEGPPPRQPVHGANNDASSKDVGTPSN